MTQDLRKAAEQAREALTILRLELLPFGFAGSHAIERADAAAVALTSALEADGERAMSETRFTPGPWLAAAKASSVVGMPIVQQGVGRAIGHVTHGPSGTPVWDAFNAESTANAKLISAAPDLYEALELLLATPEIADADPRDKDEETQIAERKARAALRKARGE